MPQPSVLIIEDDDAMLRGLSDNFRNHGYAVRTASDGKTALQSVIDQPADLVLLDIMLPAINGYEVCRRMRAQDIDSTIIMLTAKGQEEDIIRGLDLGADDYVTKPFSIRELMARAKAFLRRKAEPVAAHREFGSFRLDIEAHKLFQHDQQIELTSKEFRLLEYMLTRAGRALTRADILNQVWGDHVVVTQRSVDRCITTLRSKIEQDPRNPTWIKTIRDIGYRFEIS